MKIRMRYVSVVGCSIAAVIALLATDPDRGVSTALLGISILTGAIAVGFAFMMRKGLHDYPEADMQDLFRTAGEHPIGAGLALVALSIIFSALLGLFGRNAHAQVPPQAEQHLPALRAEIAAHWPGHPLPSYFGGLIEHESCITLTHRRCWSSTARLLTDREEGAGLGQITRTWRADGSLRFDSLHELRRRHLALSDWSWGNVHERADLQLRAVVLYSRDLWHQLRGVEDLMQRLAMADAAYNGGIGRVTADRRACALNRGCDPGQWWGHVERTCTAGRASLYGKRSACDINRHHVVDVVRVRAPRYALALP
jgi:hypothetical protein